MRSIFLSHSSIDKLFARRLAHHLEKAGVKVWIDEAELKIGDSLLQKLSEAIQSCDFVGAVLSKNSVSSQWVEKELKLAMAKEIESKRIVVLPILIDNVPIPSFLTDKIYADFRNPDTFDQSCIRLFITLGVTESNANLPKGAYSQEEVDNNKFQPMVELCSGLTPRIGILRLDMELHNSLRQTLKECREFRDSDDLHAILV